MTGEVPNVSVPVFAKFPENVKSPVPVKFIIPLFVKLPVPDCVIIPVVRLMVPSFVKFEVPVWVIPPVVMLIVPRLLTIPFTVNVFAFGANMEPRSTVIPAQVAGLVKVTVLVPVVAITTISVDVGTTLPTQVFFVVHVPPLAVLVIVAAFNTVTKCNNAINKTSLYVVP